MKFAKAVVVLDANGKGIPNCIGILSGVSSPLTNVDGYGLYGTTFAPGPTYLIVIANGARSYIVSVNLLDANENLVVGGTAPGETNLPPLSFNPPYIPVPREYVGNMCGIRVDDLPAIPGGSSDTRLVVPWLVFLYPYDKRQEIYASYRNRYKDFLTSWPDFQNNGGDAKGFLAHNIEVINAGLRPAVMLSAKPINSASIMTTEETIANIMLVLPMLLGVVGRFCQGFELNSWESPEGCQAITDALYEQIKNANAKFYVHFTQGYFSYQPNGQQSGAYWYANVNKLTGIFHQRDLSWTMSETQARITDCLNRYAGQDNCPSDSGDGTPFDFIDLEITAQLQFNDQMDEITGDSWGSNSLSTPGTMGPLGLVKVMGSGNGSFAL